MYGVIEQWLADILQIEYEPFVLNDGNRAALLDKITFMRVRNSLRVLWREDSDPATLKPEEISSDIRGIKTLIHRYWSNEEVLNGITSGEIKATESFIAFLSLSMPRFDPQSFTRRICETYASVGNGRTSMDADPRVIGVDMGHPVAIDEMVDVRQSPPDWVPTPRVERAQGNGNINVQIQGQTVTMHSVDENPCREVPLGDSGVAVPMDEVKEKSEHVEDATDELLGWLLEENSTKEKEEVKAEVHQPTEEESFIKYMFENHINHRRHQNISSKDKDRTVVIVGDNTRPNTDEIMKLSDDLNKNIIVFCDSIQNSHFSNLKKNFKFNEIAKHSLIIFIKPSENQGFRQPDVAATRTSRSLCFGEEVFNLHCLIADDVKSNIMNDSSLSSDEKKDRIESLERNPTLSIYSKYDEIFKDTCTNVVWALRDRCFIFFTFPIGMGKNMILMNKCLSELGRRFDRNLPLENMKQIDREYQGEIAKKNKDKYIKFSVDTGNKIIDEFKSQFEKEEALYKEHMDKAMEHGKLMQRLAEQIDAFDEEGFRKKQEEKALKDYEETINIPGVLSINIKDETVNVYTKNIYAQDERNKKWHDIGTFHITIGMMSNSYSQTNTVKIMNTKHQITAFKRNMQAPHVFPDGKICHGSLSTGMVEAYKRRDLFQLVYQLILFLQDANTSDPAGKYIEKWPEVSEEIATGELSFEDDEKKQPSEEELKFDSMLSDVIPIHTT